MSNMKKLIQWFKRVVLRREPEVTKYYIRVNGKRVGECKPISFDQNGGFTNHSGPWDSATSTFKMTITFPEEPTLQEKLTQAIETENYELAAIIRDQILSKR